MIEVVFEPGTNEAHREAAMRNALLACTEEDRIDEHGTTKVLLKPKRGSLEEERIVKMLRDDAAQFNPRPFMCVNRVA